MADGLGSVAEKAKNDALNNGTSLFKWFAVAGTREAELICNAPAASTQIAKATAELRQTRETISTESKEFDRNAHLKSSRKSMEDNMTFYEEREEDLKSDLAAEITQSTPISQSIDDIRAELDNLREILGPKDAAFHSILKRSCALPGPSFSSLVKISRAGPNKLVCDAFRAGSIWSPLHVDTAIDDITLRCSEATALDVGDASTKNEDVIDTAAEPRSSNCS